MKKARFNRFVTIPAVAAVLLMTSCVVDPAGNSGGGTEEAEDGYLSFSLVVDNGAGSFSRGDVTEVPGTAEENYVENVRIVLYGAADNIARYVFNFYIKSVDNYTPGEPGFEEYYWMYSIEEGKYIQDTNIPEGWLSQLYSSDSDTHFITFARKIAREDYNMLVMVNPAFEYWNEPVIPESGGDPDDFYRYDMVMNTFPGMPLGNIMSPVHIDPMHLRTRFDGHYSYDAAFSHYVFGVAEDNYFLMTNHQGLVPVTAGDIKDSAAAANSAPVNVKVSRAVAKVSMDTSVTPNVPNGTFTPLKWELDAVNRHMYYVRKMTGLLTDSGDAGATETLGHTERKNQYAEDPNFSGISAYGDVQKREQFAYIYNKEVRQFDSDRGMVYLPVYEESNPVVLDPVLANDWDATPAYCLENTFDRNDQLHDDLVTAAVVMAEYIPNPVPAGEKSYFVFNSLVITVGQMKLFADNQLLINDYPELDGLGGAMAEAGLTGSSAVTGLNGSFETAGLRYYHEGINYYRIKIVHHTAAGLDPADNPYGYYGVVRNNHYKIGIRNVRGPGSPTVDPRIPEEDNIEPVIRVLDWNGMPLNYEL